MPSEIDSKSRLLFSIFLSNDNPFEQHISMQLSKIRCYLNSADY